MLEREEMVEILEEIARSGADTARIQAIKTLLRLNDGAAVSDEDLERLIQGG